MRLKAHEGEAGGGKERTFVVMFWAVVPFVQRGGALVFCGWDFCRSDVDGGGGEIEVFGCSIGGGRGGMSVDTGGNKVEVLDCIIGGRVTESTTTPGL